MIFVNKVRELHCGRTDEELVIDIEMAIDYCVEHNILREFLISRRNEMTKNMKMPVKKDVKKDSRKDSNC